MKRVILIFLLLPIIAMAQSSSLSNDQSKQLVGKLAKLLQTYDTHYGFDFEADCNFAIFTDTNNLQGIVDLDGNVLLPNRYHIYRQYGTSLFLVVGDTTMGLIDKNMRWVLPMEYDRDIDCLECVDMCDFFGNGYACLPKEWTYGAVDTNGKILVPFKFDQPFGIDMDNRLLFFFNAEEESEVMTVTDFDGNRKIGPYQWIDRFSEGLAGFQKNDMCGFVDMKGNIVIPAKYDFTGWKFENGTALVNKDEKQMLIDKKGNVKHLFDESYEIQKPLWQNTIFIVKRYSDINFSLDGEYGVVDSKGKTLVPIEYQQCGIINDKYLVMCKDYDSCDIYDRKGALIASFQNATVATYFNYEESIFSVYSDYSTVMEDSLWGIVDSNFNIVLPCRYKELNYMGNGFARTINDDGSISVIDLSGKVIIQGPYQDIFTVNDQLFKFYAYDTKNYDKKIVGYVDIFGNTTATATQTAQMKAWIKAKK